MFRLLLQNIIDYSRMIMGVIGWVIKKVKVCFWKDDLIFAEARLKNDEREYTVHPLFLYGWRPCRFIGHRRYK